MTLSSGEFRSDESGLLYSLISTGFRRLKFCLTLNCTESPYIPIFSRLSEILQTDADEKYNLSARACQGILNRAERRGKELPKELKTALTAQAGDSTKEPTTWTQMSKQIQPSAYRETESTEQTQPDVTAQDGVGGVLHP